MNTDRKIAYTLQAIGLIILMLSYVYRWALFWPVFGMGCIIIGTYKLVSKRFKKRKSKLPLLAVSADDDFLKSSPPGYEKWRDECRSALKDNVEQSHSENDK